jgi:hypothetical protein
MSNKIHKYEYENAKQVIIYYEKEQETIKRVRKEASRK